MFSKRLTKPVADWEPPPQKRGGIQRASCAQIFSANASAHQACAWLLRCVGQLGITIRNTFRDGRNDDGLTALIMASGHLFTAAELLELSIYLSPRTGCLFFDLCRNGKQINVGCQIAFQLQRRQSCPAVRKVVVSGTIDDRWMICQKAVSIFEIGRAVKL